MAVTYKLIGHTTGVSRVFVVDVDTGALDPDGRPIVNRETTTWGMDVPLGAAKRETRLQLRAKYEQVPPGTGPGIGQAL